jgi:hypothetical protein
VVRVSREARGLGEEERPGGAGGAGCARLMPWCVEVGEALLVPFFSARGHAVAFGSRFWFTGRISLACLENGEYIFIDTRTAAT